MSLLLGCLGQGPVHNRTQALPLSRIMGGGRAVQREVKCGNIPSLRAGSCVPELTLLRMSPSAAHEGKNTVYLGFGWPHWDLGRGRFQGWAGEESATLGFSSGRDLRVPAHGRACGCSVCFMSTDLHTACLGAGVGKNRAEPSNEASCWAGPGAGLVGDTVCGNSPVETASPQTWVPRRTMYPQERRGMRQHHCWARLGDLQ